MIMALSADKLERRIINIFRTTVRSLYPDVVKSVTILEIPKSDGTVKHEVTENRGPLEIEEKNLIPLARAIAQAVVEEITSGAEVSDTTAAQTWRIK
jgi:hypothetical protein